MGARPQLPRLTREDVRDLERAAHQCDASALVLVQSSWAGKPVVLTMLDQVKQVVAGLFNRAEPAYLVGSQDRKHRMPQDVSEGPAAGVSPSDAPAAAPGQEEA